jgi:alpha-L-rhamnosidase
MPVMRIYREAPDRHDPAMTAISCERILIPAEGLQGDANILPRHPGERAAWVWHPTAAIGANDNEVAVLRFTLDVASPVGGEEVVLHLSADQRFQFRVDGELLACGPDRSSPERWAVHSYRLCLTGGAHRLEALVTYLGNHAPQAQMSLRGGFICASADAARFATGSAPWRVERLEQAITLHRFQVSTYYDAGSIVACDMRAWSQAAQAVPAVVIAGPPDGNLHGVRRTLWRLHPTRLPEQRHDLVGGGRIRAVMDGAPEIWRESADPRVARWQALVDGRGAVEVPAGAEMQVLWDLEDYRCGWCELEVAGGSDAEVRVEWAESLYPCADEAAARKACCTVSKADRSQVDGRTWLGIGDRWILDGSATTLPVLWWRAGRYVRLRIRTGAQALRLARMAIRRTGFPYTEASPFASDDAAWEATRPLLVRVLRACAHETWVDTPYYEQLCYVGDSRLDCLAAYVQWPDVRLCERTIELLDWSGRAEGLVAERFPSRNGQASTTFAMLWVLMVADHLDWRGDRAFTRTRLVGLRGVIEHLLELRGEDGLLGRLPGWSFVDWVRQPGWRHGIPPGVAEGRSSLVNLHLVLALQAAARIEQTVGDAILAARCSALAEEIGRAVVARWWDDRRGVMIDDDAGIHLSEHAQALTLLAGLLDGGRERRCLAALAAGEGMATATISFGFYIHEALYRGRRADAVETRLAWWKTLQARGLLTTVEKEDPVRSDCHAWGAHPLFHEAAAMAGIRPLSPGLARILVDPQPGSRGLVDVRIPHPGGGEVSVRWRRQGAGWGCRIELPPGIGGVFRYAGMERELQPGVSEFAAQATQS